MTKTTGARRAVLLAMGLAACSPSPDEQFCGVLEEILPVIQRESRGTEPRGFDVTDENGEQWIADLEEAAGPFHGEQEQEAAVVIAAVADYLDEASFARSRNQPFDDLDRSFLETLTLEPIRDYQAEWC